MTTYYLTNCNSPINTLFCCDKLDTIINEFLFYISNALDSLIINNINLHIDEINISNFKIVEAIDSKFGMPCILDVYEFNIKKMYFQPSNSNNNIIYIPQNLYFVKNNIKNKLNQITSNVTNKLDRNYTTNKNYGKQIHNFNDDCLAEKSDDLDCCNIESVKDAMDRLILIKNQEKQKLEEMQKELSQKVAIFEEKINEFGDKKRDLNKENEQEQNRRNKFVANKDAYYRIKKDIHDGKFSEANIPELFEKEYVVYKFMDSENLLNSDDEYILFIQLYDELNESVELQTKSQYIPHNINYLDIEDKEKYLKDNDSVNLDMIESFIRNGTSEHFENDDEMKLTEPNHSNNVCVSKKKYPSLDNVLKIVDYTDSAIKL